jgi:hypothetical protein
MEKDPYKGSVSRYEEKKVADTGIQKRASQAQPSVKSNTPAPEPEKKPEPKKNVEYIANGQTVVLRTESFPTGTTVLTPDMLQGTRVNPRLVRAKNNEIIPVKGDVFKIGREPSYADYCITDNSAISSAHAKILRKNGKFFVVDTNSSNFTYVNESMIDSNKEVEIDEGTRIRFANEEFEFHLK